MEAREVSRTTCPLRHQTGSQAIYNFDTIVAGMAPALRAAFERERAARAAELAQIIAWQECSRPESTRQRDAGASQAPKEAMMDDQIHSTTLGGVPLFRDLTPEEMIQVDARLRRMVAPAGATIVSAQQPGYAVYIVLEGVLKVTVESADGGSTILSFLGAGEVIGEMSMVWGPTCSASVVALERSTLLWMHHTDFQQCLRCIPTLPLNLAAILAQRLQRANAQMLSLITQDIYGRVARTLIECASAQAGPTTEHKTAISLRLSQSDLARMVGASRERVNLALAFYRGKGYLSAGPRQTITIHNPAALARHGQM